MPKIPGVQYAILKHRFASAEHVQYDGDGIDATKYGIRETLADNVAPTTGGRPQVIGPPAGVDVEQSLIQHPLPKPEFPGVSDVDGLSLNITVPGNVEAIINLQDLPVLVFIHGGGFILGGNWWPQYDLARFVALSIDLVRPVIAVNINYRIGAPGFLTSPELRSAGCKTNNGLRDQRAALRWIQEYIGGFGGDPRNVTVMGQSAGGGQLPMEVADGIAKDVKSALGLDDVSSNDVTQYLLDIPVEDFWTKIPQTVPMIPVIDGDIIHTRVTLRTFSQEAAEMSGKDLIERIMVGRSTLDGSIMAYSGLLARKAGIAASFRGSAAKTLQGHPDALKSLLEHYSLDEVAAITLTDDEALLNILKFITDAAFFMPAVTLASGFPKDSLVFSFDEPNPWNGLFKGHASHILDVAFLFQNYNQFLDDKQRSSAVALATDIITFLNGKAPWKPFNSSGNVCALYKGGKSVFPEASLVQQTGQSPFILETGRDETGPGMDVLMQVFSDFMTAQGI
ncbi:alpha beta-hydrolase [Fusarium albosuccineum]|uniref:Carboxylic ester hydrolase n=1 Tax=Fusarium albosuccineum TaxID=1237068 RepID=A0A8H4KVC8_9HYPO|nr:alpha beta-hydrolase [Fusarium albosuccineum]